MVDLPDGALPSGGDDTAAVDRDVARQRPASAPTGAAHPASSAASSARSAVTAARVRASSSEAEQLDQVGVGRPGTPRPARPARARAASRRVEDLGDLGRPAQPGEPGAGEHDGVELAVGDLADAGCRRCRGSARSRDQAASARSWATRRGEPVPIRAPAGRSARSGRRGRPARPAGRPAAGIAAMTRPRVRARWAGPLASGPRSRSRPSISASRSAQTKTPVPPSWVRSRLGHVAEGGDARPARRLGRSARRSASATSPDCVVARALPPGAQPERRDARSSGASARSGSRPPTSHRPRAPSGPGRTARAAPPHNARPPETSGQLLDTHGGRVQQLATTRCTRLGHLGPVRAVELGQPGDQPAELGDSTTSAAWLRSATTVGVDPRPRSAAGRPSTSCGDDAATA